MSCRVKRRVREPERSRPRAHRQNLLGLDLRPSTIFYWYVCILETLLIVFLRGYYVSETKLTFVATAQSADTLHRRDLAATDLAFRANKIAHLRRMINPFFIRSQRL
ncbi:hypothetical protein CPB83DRAFT_851391 [Crepidotus variabilis]|uniref:Uncharacterized protein n=1 Tax=Crepidotus variabilis TaxID=179855 RepID=A0A9P6EJB5_9AGAR|nr:hypothetical protein CPB83DRAFT_851391 [Crepidotus variabilis]